MRSIHSLIEDTLREASRSTRRKYEIERELPDYPTFKAETLDEAKTLANNILPKGTERKEFDASFELALKRTSENTDFGLSQVIEGAYKTLKSSKKLNK
jgi:hypothetical protein